MIELAHPLDLIVQVRNLLVCDELVFTLELDCHLLVICFNLLVFESLVSVSHPRFLVLF